MPARVEYRLGSVFDEEADLVVIPSSTDGSVAPDIADQLHKAGLPLPAGMPWGEVRAQASPDPMYRMMAYAAVVHGQSSCLAAVIKIGAGLGRLAAENRLLKITTPLLGADAGNPWPSHAVSALERGFLSTAPNSVLLVVYVDEPGDLEELQRQTPSGFGDHRPARIEYRLGSIFDGEADLLVVPTSSGGVVTPETADLLRTAGLPFPTAMPWGDIQAQLSPNPMYRIIAYAATVRGEKSSSAVVAMIGARLGKLAADNQLHKVKAPLLGACPGDLRADRAALALEDGFLGSAPDSSMLVICLDDPEEWNLLKGELSPPAAARPSGPAGSQPAAVPRTRRFVAQPHPHAGQLDAPSAAADRPAAGPHSAPRRSSGPKRTRVFISYSHQDTKWLERLQKHLQPLERDGALVWDDTRIKAGAKWRDEIREALAETKVAVLLVSADFLASDFIATDELPPLLKAAEDDGATILPVILSACGFDRTPTLSRFQAVNDPKKPLVKLRHGNREEELDRVARTVKDALKE